MCASCILPSTCQHMPTINDHMNPFRVAARLQRRMNELLGSSSGSSGSGAMRSVAGSGAGLGPLGLLQAGGGRSGSGAHTPTRSPRSPRADPVAASAAGQREQEAVSPPQQQQGQQEHVVYLPSTEQIYGRLSSKSSNGRETVPSGAPGSTAPGSTAQGGTAPGSTAQGGTAPGSTAPVMAAAEKEYLAHQIAALRISLAKRDAEVARLEGRCRNGTQCSVKVLCCGCWCPWWLKRVVAGVWVGAG